MFISEENKIELLMLCQNTIKSEKQKGYFRECINALLAKRKLEKEIRFSNSSNYCDIKKVNQAKIDELENVLKDLLDKLEFAFDDCFKAFRKDTQISSQKMREYLLIKNRIYDDAFAITQR